MRAIIFAILSVLSARAVGIDVYDDLPICNVLILGKTGAGKSTTGNAFAGKDIFYAADDLSSVTTASEKKMFTRYGTRYMFVDTPGIFDTGATINETVVEITNVVYLAPEGFHAILLQMNPMNRFTAEERRALEGLIGFGGGQKVLNHVILTWSYGDKWTPTRIAEKQHTFPKELQYILKAVGGRVIPIDVSTDEASEASAKMLHDAIKKLSDTNGGITFSNDAFRHARSKLDEISMSLDPEKKIEAMSRDRAEKEKEFNETIRRERQEREQMRVEFDGKVRSVRDEIENEYARRSMEQQRALHERELEMERRLAQEREEARQRERELERRIYEARAETQTVVYRDYGGGGGGGGSWCSIL